MDIAMVTDSMQDLYINEEVNLTWINSLSAIAMLLLIKTYSIKTHGIRTHSFSAIASVHSDVIAHII